MIPSFITLLLPLLLCTITTPSHYIHILRTTIITSFYLPLQNLYLLLAIFPFLADGRTSTLGITVSGPLYSTLATLVTLQGNLLLMLFQTWIMYPLIHPVSWLLPQWPKSLLRMPGGKKTTSYPIYSQHISPLQFSPSCLMPTMTGHLHDELLVLYMIYCPIPTEGIPLVYPCTSDPYRLK